ncbi:G8 domain-containing protein [Methylocucumis oryzae]|uniref:G8 domain-containing protein n=1 Tax=Methylocucumis oryzae TaxID=1632867 RepID=UPI000696FD64|nr:G8 domain-containing protein [Methylocucumis oryzae]
MKQFTLTLGLGLIIQQLLFNTVLACDTGQFVLEAIPDQAENAGTVSVNISRIGGTCGKAWAIVTTSDGSANANQDYSARSRKLIWNDGEGGSKPYPIRLINDKSDEPDEQLTVAIVDAKRATIATAEQSMLIVDNDAAPTLRFDTSTAPTIEEGQTIDIPVVLSVASGYDIEVNLNYAETASSPDFSLLPASVIIPKGVKTHHISLQTVSDALTEQTERLQITMSSANHAVLANPSSYRFDIVDPPNPACPNDAVLWSNPNSWPSGAVPVAGDTVTIPAGHHIALDTNPPALAGLTIEGALSFCRQDLALTSEWILLTGELHIGSEAEPFTHHALITLNDTDTEENISGMGTRGLLVMGGLLELHGNAPSVSRTKLTAHAQPNDTLLQIENEVQWQAGDEVIIAPTDFYGIAATELNHVAGSSGEKLLLQTPLSAFRWGLLQYPTETGMSLTDEQLVTPPASTELGATPLVLDERAEIANLTRNIVIQAPDDEVWQQQGFGAHVMIMQAGAQARIDGVEFHRVGQRHRLGRYPYHSHRRSYAADGALLADVTGDYLRNSTIHQSTNRCITIHATNGLEVANNICYDIQGHGIFFEDAVERRNIVEDNLILHVRNPAPDMALKVHECCAAGPTSGSGSSGLWVSNPDNTVRNNTAADAEGFGLWMAFPAQPVGQSANVAMIPNRLTFGNFDNNTTHSNAHEGIMFDVVETDNDGNVAPLQYWSTSDGQPSVWPFENLRRISITGIKTWKNGSGGFWNRVVWPDYQEFVSADNHARYFAGSGAEGNITRSLVVGTSLNNSNPRPNAWLGHEVAFASYHSAYSMFDNIVVNFPLQTGGPLVAGGRSGAFDTSDYYIRAVDKGHIRNSNNLLVNSHGGLRTYADFNHYVLSGALWDPQGIWGPVNHWYVYDEPFFTHNAVCQPVEPIGQTGASCDGDYYGVDGFVVNQGNDPFDATMAIAVSRFDETQPALLVGQWNVANGLGLQPFPNKTSFCGAR